MNKVFEKIYESSKLDLAFEWAKLAHDDAGQTRKGTGDRYWVHPQGVKQILEGYGETDEDVLCAAFLHDTVEDTDISINILEKFFGSKVAEIVGELTNDNEEIDHLERTTYKGQKDSKTSAKQEYMNKKLINLSEMALKVKLADFYYNSTDRPKEKQLERMKKNIEFLKSHRRSILKDSILRRLIHALETAYGYES